MKLNTSTKRHVKISHKDKADGLGISKKKGINIYGFTKSYDIRF
jgi:hypothetical protein